MKEEPLPLPEAGRGAKTPPAPPRFGEGLGEGFFLAISMEERTMIRVSIASPQEIVEPPYAKLREVGRVVLEGEGVTEAKISLAFVDDATIHGLNKRFLNHDEPTDVITFPLSGPGAKKLEGELVVGVEVAKRQADERGHAVDAELCLYVIHGLLHLCGYDDKKPKDAAQMRVKERHYLKTLGLPEIAGE